MKKKKKYSGSIKKNNPMMISGYGSMSVKDSDRKKNVSSYKMNLSLLANIIIVVLIVILFYVFDAIISDTKETPEIKMPINEAVSNEEDLSASPYSPENNFSFMSFVFEEPLPKNDIEASENPKLFQDSAMLPQPSPLIAIVIDDMGFNGYKTEDVISLPPPINLSFIPYVTSLSGKIKKAMAAGHEIMIHMPMQASDSKIDSGPDTLKTSMDEKEIASTVSRTLEKFSYFSGINNHMGSKFTADKKVMTLFMQQIKDKGVFFLDSKTTPASVGKETATAFDIPYVERDIFLDNVREEKSILRQLDKLEKVARKRGYSIGIGHPYRNTITALEKWIPKAKEKGYRFISLKELIDYLNTSPYNPQMSSTDFQKYLR